MYFANLFNIIFLLNGHGICEFLHSRYPSRDSGPCYFTQWTCCFSSSELHRVIASCQNTASGPDVMQRDYAQYGKKPQSNRHSCFIAKSAPHSLCGLSWRTVLRTPRALVNERLKWLALPQHPYTVPSRELLHVFAVNRQKWSSRKVREMINAHSVFWNRRREKQLPAVSLDVVNAIALLRTILI